MLRSSIVVKTTVGEVLCVSKRHVAPDNCFAYWHVGSSCVLAMFAHRRVVVSGRCCLLGRNRVVAFATAFAIGIKSHASMPAVKRRTSKSDGSGPVLMHFGVVRMI